MSRKFKKGYFVRGQFVAEGSELDLQLKAELKGQEVSRTDLKRESLEIQKVGEALMDLRAELLAGLNLPDRLLEAMAEAKRITNFEGKRRQMQFVGKLMRQLDPETLEAARQALAEQHHVSAADAMSLHEAERWRDDLIADDEAITRWLGLHPDTDTQQLRALVRQARKDVQPDRESTSKGLAPRHGRAYREIFQLVKTQLMQSDTDQPADDAEVNPP